MKVGIDASNIQGGGGLSHLRNLLAAAHPMQHGIQRVVVWSSSKIIERLPQRPWLEKVAVPALDRDRLRRLLWQQLVLPRLAKTCDLLFAPGGHVPAGIHPVLTMSRNMLPFDRKECSAYGNSMLGWRLRLLRVAHRRTLSQADGVIFLNQFAHDTISRQVDVRGAVRIISHGIEPRFRQKPRAQRPLQDCSVQRPLRAVYVSAVDLYKHQWNVAEAAAQLRARGIPIDVTFVGKSYRRALARLRGAMQRFDPEGQFLHYRGPLPFEAMHSVSRAADLSIFASSCECLSNALLESMAGGLPIASSNLGSMPSILGDACVYFDPYDVADIARAVDTLATDEDLRARCAWAAYERAKGYSWERCAEETFAFLRSIGLSHR